MTRPKCLNCKDYPMSFTHTKEMKDDDTIMEQGYYCYRCKKDYIVIWKLQLIKEIK